MVLNSRENGDHTNQLEDKTFQPKNKGLEVNSAKKMKQFG